MASTDKFALLLIIMISAISISSRLSADNIHTIKTPSLNVGVSYGTLAVIKSNLTNERFASSSSDKSLAGLQSAPMKSAMFSTATVATEKSDTNIRQTAIWDDQSKCTSYYKTDENGDILITQYGKSTNGGLYGISWGIVGIPDSFTILAPGESGQKFGSDAADGIRRFDYPFTWESPFVLIQGEQGGIIVYAEDPALTFKTLFVEHTDNTFLIRFESRNQAPFDNQKYIKSVKWRISAYKGPWQKGAEIYRQWMVKLLKPIPLTKKTPAWAKDIQFVVTMGMDIPIIGELAKKVDPVKTLLYIPEWRRDGYDRNYPDYTALPAFPKFVDAAHKLGFKVMAHVNYFGCDPKNPYYEQLKKYHLKDPFTKELQWWCPHVDQTIKIAYINPASKLWRRIFVYKMKELVDNYKVDALHIDQTLIMMNDANGIIDGMNTIQGNIQLHKDLYKAIPNVAISGEGLNEITCIYETFAQRHVIGIDLWNGTWNNHLLSQAHPVSSYILTPYTTMYGYLGMPNASQNTGTFTAWRKAYENFGVIPTLPRPTIEQIRDSDNVTSLILNEAVFFQKYHPVPDFDSIWKPNDLFRYKLNNGNYALYRKDNGVVFGVEDADGKTNILSRRIYGVNKVEIDGSIPGWRGYNEQTIIGLNPNINYFWVQKPREMDTLRISDISIDNITLADAGVHDSFARFRLDNLAANITLWDFTGAAYGGVLFANGAESRHSGAFFTNESGGNIQNDGKNLAVHPPWMSNEPSPKTDSQTSAGITFVEYTIDFPEVSKITFSTGLSIRNEAVGKSDGIELKATASDNEIKLSDKLFNDQSEPVHMVMDLSPFSGKKIKLRFEIGPGPKGDPSFDWGLIISPKIDLEFKQQGSVDLVSNTKPDSILTADGDAEIIDLADNTYKINLQLPNTITIPFTAPKNVKLPCKLADMQFNHSALTSDGREMEPFGYSSAGYDNAACNNDTRMALNIHPPDFGKTMVDYYLQLPKTPSKLVTAIGLKDGSKSSGVIFEIWLNGKTVLSQKLIPNSGWIPIEVDLTPYAARPLMLTFAADSIDSAYFDWAVWADPVIVKK